MLGRTRSTLVVVWFIPISRQVGNTLVLVYIVGIDNLLSGLLFVKCDNLLEVEFGSTKSWC